MNEELYDVTDLYEAVKINDELKEENHNLYKELERYKNIIDELENRMLLKINRHYNEKQYVICIADLEELYDKLKELKGE